MSIHVRTFVVYIYVNRVRGLMEMALIDIVDVVFIELKCR